VLENFSRQMKDLFGGQAAGINNLQQQTIDALQSAVATLERMAADVGAEGQRSTSAIAEQLAESIAAAESRQRIMNEQLGEFVAQMRQISVQSQSEAQEKLQGTLSELSERMSKVIDGLSNQVRSATEASAQQQQVLTARSENIVGQFGEQAVAMVDGVNRAVGEMKAAVMAMRNTTGDAMSKLNNGADTLYLAAKDFAKAGQGVTATLDKSASLASQLTQSAGSVASATKGLSGMLADYNAARDSMIAMVGSLQLLVEQVQRDASMSGSVIARIEAATEKLTAAQKEAEDYLGKVSEVIGTAHESFSDGMVKAVGEANREFHQALSDSVKLLREGIQELESTLDAATSL
jgi:ABC-type transporter Mla subunit MlaD